MSKVNIKAIEQPFRISKILYLLEKNNDFAEFKVHHIHRKQAPRDNTVLILCDEEAGLMAVIKFFSRQQASR